MDGDSQGAEVTAGMRGVRCQGKEAQSCHQSPGVKLRMGEFEWGFLIHTPVYKCLSLEQRETDTFTSQRDSE